MPEWEYDFHGRGCCLTNRITGEVIDVDFHGAGADDIDRWFYLRYLRSLRSPEPPERRLLDLHPSVESVMLAIDELQADGMLSGSSGSAAIQLGKLVRKHKAVTREFCSAWQEPGRRLRLAAEVGDWLFVEEAAVHGDAAVAKLATESGASLRADRKQALVGQLGRGDDSSTRKALYGLADMGDADLSERLRRVMRGPIAGVISVAFSIVRSRADAATWNEEVLDLLNRLDPNGQPPHPHLWITGVEFLLRYGDDPAQARALLQRTGGHAIADAAILALEYAPELAVSLFRRALRSAVPINRSTSAPALAVLDVPWSRAELLSLLDESTEQQSTAQCRAALAESRDPAVRQAARDWEETNPHEPQQGPFITGAEAMLLNAPAFVQAEMEKLRPRLAKLARDEAQS